jgi:hypothetical protein
MNTGKADFRGLNFKKICVHPYKSAFIRVLFLLLLSSTVFSQNLPDELRGYKVYKAKINVQNQTGKTDSKETGTILKLNDPELIDISLTGVTLEITGEVSTDKQSGHVDFLAFKNFRVNGLEVEIEEYREAFDFKKNQTVKFPKPIKIFLSLGQAMSGVLKEWRESKDIWQVTGRVFVFGRFKKFGFKFKRVIPVDVNLLIKNPLKNYRQ